MSEFLNPLKVINEISLQEEMSVADFGCGSGGWVIPLAKKIKDGKIYALDVLKEALSALKSNADLEKVYNIRTILCDVERGTELHGKSLDLVIMSNLLFQVDDKDGVLEEGKRVLRDGGHLLIVDWNINEDSSSGVIEEKILAKGFKKIKSIDAGSQHFANYYEKI
jgi:ubiquinone/menaquinone biosynthesis C-methylase UbiE